MLYRLVSNKFEDEPIKSHPYRPCYRLHVLDSFFWREIIEGTNPASGVENSDVDRFHPRADGQGPELKNLKEIAEFSAQGPKRSELNDQYLYPPSHAVLNPFYSFVQHLE